MHYNGQFKPMGSINITGREIDEANQYFEDFERKKRYDVSKPYFSDAKLHKGSLYLMLRTGPRMFYRVDLATGETKSKARFLPYTATGKATKMFMRLFALFPDDTFVVTFGHAPPVGMDSFLMKGKLPENF